MPHLLPILIALSGVAHALAPVDADGDGVAISDDCNDSDPTVGACSLFLDESDLYIGDRGSFANTIGTGGVRASDIDADGTADLVFSNYLQDDRGAIVVMDGSSHARPFYASFEIRGGERDMDFGRSFDAGDVDGDGNQDLVVVAPPTAYVFLGPTTAGTFAGDASVSWTVPVNNGVPDIAVVSDHDGDGNRDVAVGMWAAGPDYQGTVAVASDVLDGTESLSGSATYQYRGQRTFGKLGRNVADVGDDNGDGVSDLAITAWTGRYKPGVGVYVVEGGGTPGAYRVDAVASATVTETKAKPTELGSSLVGADYDGDGFSDLVVSAPGRDVEWGDRAGTVYVFLGPISGALTPDDAPIRWEGRDDQSGWLGRTVSVRDADDDGQSDVIMGAYGTHTAFLQLGLATGAVPSSDLIAVDAGSVGSVWTNASAFVPDWTGDGVDEIAIGLDDQLGAEVGGVYVMYSDGLF